MGYTVLKLIDTRCNKLINKQLLVLECFSDGNNPQSAGNLFYVGFMRSIVRDAMRPSSKVQLLVSTNESDPVMFSVVTSPDGNISNVTYTAMEGIITKVELSADVFQVGSDTDRKKGIRVQAEPGKTISLYGVGDEFHSSDGFLGLSCDGMKIGTDTTPYTGYEYIVLSGVFVGKESAPQSSSELLIIPCEDTRITIYSSQAITFFVKNKYRLSNNHWTGNAGETYYITYKGDLSGTIIRSSKPITLYVGHQCAETPPGSTNCHHIVEQIPPHTTWGHTHFLNATESGDVVYRVGTVHNSTQVTVTCSYEGRTTTYIPIETTTLNRAYNQSWLQFVPHEVPNEPLCPEFTPTYCCVEATNPVLVVQYGQGYITNNNCTSVPSGRVRRSGALFMIVIPPVIQYLNNYSFSFTASENDSFPLAYANIAVHKTFFQPDMIMMDGGPVQADQTQWNPLYCSGAEICGYGISKEVDNGNHTIYHEMEGAALGVILYGFQQQSSFGFPAGMELQPVSGEYSCKKALIFSVC